MADKRENNIEITRKENNWPEECQVYESSGQIEGHGAL